MGPDELLQIEHKEIVEAFGAVPSTEDIEVILDDAGAVIGSRWWPGALDILHTSPVHGRCVQLVQIVEVVSPITTPEDVDLILKTVSSVHVAGARRLSSALVVQPFELLEVQDVHVVSCKRPLPQPSPNDVKAVLNQCRSVSIPSLRRYSARLLRSDPAVAFGIKDPQVTMILFAIVATKNVQFLVEKRGSVILDLRSQALIRLTIGVYLFLGILVRLLQVREEPSHSPSLIALSLLRHSWILHDFVTFRDKNPLELFGLFLIYS